MARIRTIKPEFFTSNDIVTLTPLSRLFYIALWCESDREGRLSWNLKTFKMRYLPADDFDINALAKELIDAELIIVYEINGKEYAEIPSFKNHQVINNRESDSIIIPRVKVACKRVLAEGRKEGKEGKEESSNYLTSIDKKILSDYLKLRKAKKAGEFTETAFNSMMKESEKCNLTIDQAIEYCCKRSWVGFESAWYFKDNPKVEKNKTIGKRICYDHRNITFKIKKS